MAVADGVGMWWEDLRAKLHSRWDLLEYLEARKRRAERDRKLLERSNPSP